MRKRTKRYFLLLEVLISLALVSLCLIPLIAPIVIANRSVSQLTLEMEAERGASQAYTIILKEMHEETIPFSELFIKAERELQIPHSQLRFSYHFGEAKIKKENEQPKYLLLPVVITVTPRSGKPLTFTYQVFVEKGSDIK